MNPPTPSPVLLNLGCGTIVPDGWVNLDSSLSARVSRWPLVGSLVRTLAGRHRSKHAWPKTVRYADLRRNLPFADGSVDGVFSSHFIEHLHHNEALAILKESHRVLKPGSPCRTLIPDLSAIIHQYLSLTHAQPNQASTYLMENLGLRPLKARQGLRELWLHISDAHSHKFMYDEAGLIALMQQAGFKNCQRKTLHDSAIPTIEKVELPVRFEQALCVEGVK